MSKNIVQIYRYYTI